MSLIDTVENLMRRIYEDNATHFDFTEDMSGGECDCVLHAVMDMIHAYSEGVE